ncbi:hypothetical protein ACN2XU_09000 [Primorskyibacter sp. 2E107]|uniref:hypothetical protein n=1 Tax=Primorskyibacter sp. 2E107 TaxID=3403458 RepID=UPI003AF41AA6
MNHFATLYTGVLLGLLTLCAPVSAQTVLSGNYSIDGRFCAGPDCWNTEDFTNTTLKLKQVEPRLVFEDSSTAGFPSVDWRMDANGSSPTEGSYFAISNVDANRTLFTLRANAPANAFYLDDSGDLGLGTSIPQADLHLVDASNPGIAFETAGGGHMWRLHGNAGGFYLSDPGSSTLPFEIRTNAPDRAFYIDATGKTGLGTAAPAAALHVLRTDGSAALRVENTAPAPAAVREMFNMTNNGGSYFTLTNTSASASWYFVHENNAPNRFMINHSDGGVQMALTRTGDLTIPGALYTAGSCDAGCDRVFDEDYPLPTIAEQAAMMREMKHLPNVGPTDEDGPFNLTAMTGGMLNELEKAHLYIGQLHDTVSKQAAEITGQSARIADQDVAIRALLNRVARLEQESK